MSQESIDRDEVALVKVLQDNLGLSDRAAISIVTALGDYIITLAEDRANNALDREFNRGDYRG